MVYTYYDARNRFDKEFGIGKNHPAACVLSNLLSYASGRPEAG